MKINVKTSVTSGDLLIVLVPEKSISKAYSKMLGTPILKEMEGAAKDTEFNKNRGDVMLMSANLKGVKRVLAMGMGKIKTPADYHDCVAAAVKKANSLKVKDLTVVLPNELDLSRAISGAYKGNYYFKIGDSKDSNELKSVTFVSTDKESITHDVALGESMNMVKDLVNYPANYIFPESLEKESRAMARKHKNLKLTVLTPKQMMKLKMDSLLSVAKGSGNPPRILVFEYNGGKKNEPPIALVGKGVTFDSGGYNLKPTRYIEDMKCDMAGAATVMGLMQYFAKTKPKHNIVGIVGAVENLIGHEAYKPGDIVTAMNGKTIEIGNTDAEGRLVMADAMCYVQSKYKPAVMIDFATLTGSCMAALGYHISGVMGNDQRLIDHLKKASEAADEQIWQLPLNEYFKEKTKGSISDLVNVTDGVMAGASMAAAFLSNFVDDKVCWAHFDIAGTAFNGKGQSGGAKYATGVMMRTIAEWTETL